MAEAAPGPRQLDRPSDRVFLMSARASAMRWRWPPDSLTPLSPISVSAAAGRLERTLRLRETRRTFDPGTVRVEIAVPDVVANAGIEEQRVCCVTTPIFSRRLCSPLSLCRLRRLGFVFGLV